MPKNSKIDEYVLNIVEECQLSLQLWVSQPLDISLFRLLLRLAREKLQVELILGVAYWDYLVINVRYLEQFTAAGGSILYHEHPEKQRTFLLLDSEKLLVERYVPTADSYRLTQMPSGEIVDYQNIYEELRLRSIEYSTLSKNEEQTRPRLIGVDNVPSSRPSESLHKQVKIQFSVRPEWVEIEEPFELSWEVSGAKSIYINQGIGRVGTRGHKILRAQRDVAFKLTVDTANEQFSSYARLQVNSALKIMYYLTTPDHGTGDELPLKSLDNLPHHFSVVAGQLLRLYWRIFNADEHEVSGVGPVPREGVHDFICREATTITLKAKKGEDSVRETIIIHILNLSSINHFLLTQKISQQIPNIGVDYKLGSAVDKIMNTDSFSSEEEIVSVNFLRFRRFLKRLINPQKQQNDES